MFWFSTKFEWSFSNLPRFNWSCLTLPKCFKFTQMFRIYPKLEWRFLVGPIWWKLLELPNDSNPLERSVYFAIMVKKNGKIVSDFFAVSAIILPLIWSLFCLSWEIDTTSLTCQCSYILCPNVKNFCLNNDQFFSVGDATASPASPCRTFMATHLCLRILLSDVSSCRPSLE